MLKELTDYISAEQQRLVKHDQVQANIEKFCTDRDHNWHQDVDQKMPMTPAQLRALNDAARAFGRPLTPDQAREVLARVR